MAELTRSMPKQRTMSDEEAASIVKLATGWNAAPLEKLLDKLQGALPKEVLDAAFNAARHLCIDDA